MAKLVIVESPAKAKTIGKYLGKDYEVTASMGHIRDLPASQLGIDVEHDYTPQYISIKGKEKLIKELKSKYFRALDTKNWDELETTMTPNISTAYSNGKLVFHGPKEITNYFKESMPHTEITLHQGHNPVIWFESDTVAYGKWYLQDNLIFAEGNPYCGTQIQGSAIYTDKYVKVDGQWLIEDTGYLRVYEESFQRDNTHRIRINMFRPKKKKVVKKK